MSVLIPAGSNPGFVQFRLILLLRSVIVARKMVLDLLQNGSGLVLSLDFVKTLKGCLAEGV